MRAGSIKCDLSTVVFYRDYPRCRSAYSEKLYCQVSDYQLKIATVIQYEIRPTTIENSPTMRSWPSLNRATFIIVSRHTLGARKGSRPSMTSTRQSAPKISNSGFADVQWGGHHLPLPLFFRNLKKSALGSSTMTSDLLLNVALYASKLR